MSDNEAGRPAYTLSITTHFITTYSITAYSVTTYEDENHGGDAVSWLQRASKRLIVAVIYLVVVAFFVGTAIFFTDPLSFAGSLSKMVFEQPCIGVLIRTQPEGVGIAGVQDTSPAEFSTLATNDIILTFNGTRVNTTNELIEAVRGSRPGFLVSVEYLTPQSEQRSTSFRLGYFENDDPRECRTVLPPRNIPNSTNVSSSRF